MIAPEVDRIERAKFQNEVLSLANLIGYEITFASLLRDTPASSIQTTFQSSVALAAEAEPHTFSVTVSVQDEGPMIPAVANSNHSFCICARKRGGPDRLSEPQAG